MNPGADTSLLAAEWTNKTPPEEQMHFFPFDILGYATEHSS